MSRRIDPRIRITQILLFSTCAFLIRSVAGIAIEVVALILFLVYLRLYAQGMKLGLYYVAVSFLFWLMPSEGARGILAVLTPLLFLLRKLSPVVGVFFVFSTITVSELVAALGKLRCPKALVLPLAVALRFIPTIRQEVGIIRDALKVRGKPLTLFSLLRSPLEMSEYILMPLMMRCIKIADELSASAVARGIENPLPRTSRLELKIGRADIAYLSAALLCSVPLVFL